MTAVCFLIAGCLCQRTETKSFELSSKTKERLKFLASESHPFGSDRQLQMAAYLEREASTLGAVVYQQKFTTETPNPELVGVRDPGPRRLTVTKDGANLYALNRTDRDCVLLIGSHYDTKLIEGIEYLGANDSGSSSVLLLDLLAFFISNKDFSCALGMVWFDGEESTLPGWYDGENKHPAKIKDNTYGSRYAVSKLRSTCGLKSWGSRKCLPKEIGDLAVIGLILTDMVGSPDLKITQLSNVDSRMLGVLRKALRNLKLSQILTSNPRNVEDDHAPFLRVGIPAIDLIDFENVDFWHNPKDTEDKISYQSIETVGQIVVEMSRLILEDPQGIL